MASRARGLLVWALPDSRSQVALGWRALLASLGVTVVCWAVLAWRYPVWRFIGDPRFSLGKVEPLYRLTPDLLAFVFLGLAYLWGYACLRAVPRLGRAVVGGLVVTLLLAGVGNVVLYPVGARDVYHYLMMLDVVVHYHGNPYVSVYSSFPPDVFAPYRFVSTSPLGYGPGWLLFSLLPAPIAGFSRVLDTLLVYKAYNLLLVMATALVIWLGCGRGRAGLAAAYLYAMNPLVLFEGVGNAHNDVMTAFLLALAVVALRRQHVTAPALLAAAISVKFYPAPVALVFAYCLWRQHWSPRKLVVAALLAAATVVAIVAPFWSGGQMLTGLREGGLVCMRGLYSSSLLSLAREIIVEAGLVSARTVEVAAGALLVAASCGTVYAARRRREPAVVVALLVGWALLLATNLFPWYLVTVLAVIAVSGDGDCLRYLFPATLLGMLYYFVSITSWTYLPTRSLIVHLIEACVTTLPLLVFVVWRTLGLARESDEAPAA